MVRRACLVLLFCAAAIGIVVLASKVHKSWTLASAEDQMVEAYAIYASRPFAEATNALIDHIRYVSNHRQHVADKLKVDYVLFIAHGKLSLMYAYARDVTNSHGSLKEAYRHHRMAGLQPVPASQFVDHVIAGHEKIDSRTGVAWKTGLEFPTNTISELRKLSL